MDVRARGGVVAAVLGGLVLALAGLAWACTPQPQIVELQPTVASPGQQVTVQAKGLRVEQPVAVRWDGLSGPVVGSGAADADGVFAGEVTVPADASPGVHSLVAVADEDTGVARTALEVTEATGPGETSPPTADVATSGWSTTSEYAEAQAAESGMQAPFMAGVALLGLGLVVLSAGAVAAVTTRRPVLARQKSGPRRTTE